MNPLGGFLRPCTQAIAPDGVQGGTRHETSITNHLPNHPPINCRVSWFSDFRATSTLPKPAVQSDVRVYFRASVRTTWNTRWQRRNRSQSHCPSPGPSTFARRCSMWSRSLSTPLPNRFVDNRRSHRVESFRESSRRKIGEHGRLVIRVAGGSRLEQRFHIQFDLGVGCDPL